MKSLNLIVAAALLLGENAQAADRHAWRVGNDSIHLYYSDLDMNSAAGRAEMLARVGRAAQVLCRSRLRIEEDECVRATVAKLGSGLAPMRYARAHLEGKPSGEVEE